MIKNKKADITNFFRTKENHRFSGPQKARLFAETSLNKELPFDAKRRPKANHLFYNKKADIGITLLVISVIILFGAALLTFNYFSKKSVETTLKSFFYVEGIYNIADSANYSNYNYGREIFDSYHAYQNLKMINEEALGNGQPMSTFRVEGEFFNGDLKIVYDTAKS